MYKQNWRTDPILSVIEPNKNKLDSLGRTQQNSVTSRLTTLLKLGNSVRWLYEQNSQNRGTKHLTTTRRKEIELGIKATQTTLPEIKQNWEIKLQLRLGNSQESTQQWLSGSKGKENERKQPQTTNRFDRNSASTRWNKTNSVTRTRQNMFNINKPRPSNLNQQPELATIGEKRNEIVVSFIETEQGRGFCI